MIQRKVFTAGLGIVFGLFGPFESMSWANSPQIHLRLRAMQEKALQYSPRLLAIRSEEDSARSHAEAQHTFLFPKLYLDASYRYQSVVPSLTFPLPGAPNLSFGDNNNYSIGPALQWTALDFGANLNSWKSASETEKAKSQERQSVERQVLLLVRQAYFRVQLALEQMHIISDSLALSEAQYQDIRHRYQAGTSSRLDSLSAHKEVLSYSVQLRRSQADLSAAIRELYAVSGEPLPADFSKPVTAVLQKDASRAENEAPTVWVQADPISESLETVKTEVPLKYDLPMDANPQLQTLAHQSESALKAGDASQSGLYPKLQFSAKSSYDYPNGPIKDHIQQNIVAMSLTMPLFEFSRTRLEAQATRSQALALEARREQSLLDLQRDWNQALDQLAALQEQQKLLRESAAESVEVARLTYDSYTAGRSTFLEVQSANLRSLDARVQATRNDVQILIQLALINNLAPPLPMQGTYEK